jgi:hypothetical protein
MQKFDPAEEVARWIRTDPVRWRAFLEREKRFLAGATACAGLDAVVRAFFKVGDRRMDRFHEALEQEYDRVLAELGKVAA